MIYDPITRQEVAIIGSYPEQHDAFKLGQKIQGTFRFVRCRYGEHTTEWAKERGGFPLGHERDVDLNNLVADNGAVEISEVYDASPLITD